MIAYCTVQPQPRLLQCTKSLTQLVLSVDWANAACYVMDTEAEEKLRKEVQYLTRKSLADSTNACACFIMWFRSHRCTQGNTETTKRQGKPFSCSLSNAVYRLQ